MAETSFLASPSTTGYTEERLAAYRDDGTLELLTIQVKWDDGTQHTLVVTLGGPPDYAFTQAGALLYPDGSGTAITVQPDGRIEIDHSARWQSDESADQSETLTDKWVYDRDGTGQYRSLRDYQDGTKHGFDLEWHTFDRDGVLTSATTEEITEYDSLFPGQESTTTVTVELGGKRTTNVVVKDADGNITFSQNTVDFVAPLVEHPPTTTQRRGQGTTTDTAPSRGPQPGRTSTGGGGGGGGGGGIEGWGRKVTGGGQPQCEHWVDYYMAAREGPDRYLGSSYRGVGPC